jgi:hypothetical protein
MHRDDLLKMEPEQLRKLCVVSSYQASGKGGQKRNKVASGIQLHLKDHFPEIQIKVCTQRSPELNLKQALSLLKHKLAVDVRSQALSSFGPFPGSQQHINPSNPKYPMFMALSLDRIQEDSGEIKGAAEAWGLSTSALNRILFADKVFLTQVQNIRLSFNKRPLHS